MLYYLVRSFQYLELADGSRWLKEDYSVRLWTKTFLIL